MSIHTSRSDNISDRKALDCPDQPEVTGPIMHQGFTKEEVHTLLNLCAATGVEMTTICYLPEPRCVHWMAMAEQDSRLHCHLVDITRKCEYPFTEFQKICQEAARDSDLVRSLGNNTFPTTPGPRIISWTEMSHPDPNDFWIRKIIEVRRECVYPYANFTQICQEAGRGSDMVQFFEEIIPRISIT